MEHFLPDTKGSGSPRPNRSARPTGPPTARNGRPEPPSGPLTPRSKGTVHVSPPAALPHGTDRRIVITGAEAGLRIDVALTRLLPDESRSSIQRLIREGHATRDGRPLKPGEKAAEGWVVKVSTPVPRKDEAGPEAIPLSVLHEDASLLVIDKPAGMVVHPAPGNAGGTLVNALLAHCRDLSGVGGVERPGIVHRLDKGTSGVIVVAKTDAAHRDLSRQFKDRRVSKSYLAVVWDNIAADEGTVALPIGRDRRDRVKMSPRTDHGREASTAWRVIRRLGPFTLVEASPRTGRTHQIRVHLAAVGHPIVGDPLYGRRAKGTGLSKHWKKALTGVRRPLLHAWRLTFDHPADGRPMTFEAPLPADLTGFMGDPPGA
jgi:23S rRNA pseudouridine1911/1915/1917 synthase